MAVDAYCISVSLVKPIERVCPSLVVPILWRLLAFDKIPYSLLAVAPSIN
jgi:hypothetical protein